MQAFPIDNPTKYAALVSECKRNISQTWEDPNFRAEFKQNVLNAAMVTLESLLLNARLNTENCVFVVAGKSAEISLSLLRRISDHTENPSLRALISSTIVLEEEENKGMYSGVISPSLKAATAGKTIVFIDEHSEDYAKAISFLSTADRAEIQSKFFVFAGRAIRSNTMVAEYGTRIVKATAKDSIVDFLKNLGRLESERVRVQTYLPAERKASLGHSVVEDLNLAFKLTFAFKRE